MMFLEKFVDEENVFGICDEFEFENVLEMVMNSTNMNSSM